MTSATKIRANRRNALRSTGPRSPAGKAIAARNSRRHGLTLPVLDEPSLARDVVALARRIETSELGREADAAGHVLACRIAEAMIDLRRVRLAKHPLTAALHADPCKDVTLTQLWRLDRYERYALGRRKRAIREFGDATIAMRVAAALARRAAARIDKTKPTEKRQCFQGMRFFPCATSSWGRSHRSRVYPRSALSMRKSAKANLRASASRLVRRSPKSEGGRMRDERETDKTNPIRKRQCFQTSGLSCPAHLGRTKPNSRHACPVAVSAEQTRSARARPSPRFDKTKPTRKTLQCQCL